MFQNFHELKNNYNFELKFISLRFENILYSKKIKTVRALNLMCPIMNLKNLGLKTLEI